MNNTLKIYMLTLISFVVGTSQFAIVGMLDKIASSFNVSISTAGQLVTVFALANAIGTPLIVVATATVDKQLDVKKYLHEPTAYGLGNRKHYRISTGRFFIGSNRHCSHTHWFDGCPINRSIASVYRIRIDNDHNPTDRVLGNCLLDVWTNSKL
jgi:hypothetical protein